MQIYVYLITIIHYLSTSRTILSSAERRLLNTLARQFGAQAGEQLFRITEDATRFRGESVGYFVMERLVAFGKKMVLTGADFPNL